MSEVLPPVADEVNALPERLRKYIAHLETDADPAGALRDNFRLVEENKMLRAECSRLAHRHAAREEAA